MSKKELVFEISFLEDAKVRSEDIDGELWFSVVDSVAAAKEDMATPPKDYWASLKKRLRELDGIESLTFCKQLKLTSSDGKRYKTDCAKIEDIFRILQSVPGKKVEPVKQWMAKLAATYVKEMAKRRTELGDWEKVRAEGKKARKNLTSNWAYRGLREPHEYSFLTNLGYKIVLDGEAKDIRQRKRLPEGENVRDHLSPIESSLMRIQEYVTVELATDRNAYGMEENKECVVAGSNVARNTRNEIEKITGKSVLSSANNFHLLGKGKSTMLEIGA